MLPTPCPRERAAGRRPELLGCPNLKERPTPFPAFTTPCPFLALVLCGLGQPLFLSGSVSASVTGAGADPSQLQRAMTDRWEQPHRKPWGLCPGGYLWWVCVCGGGRVICTCSSCLGWVEAQPQRPPGSPCRSQLVSWAKLCERLQTSPVWESLKKPSAGPGGGGRG